MKTMKVKKHEINGMHPISAPTAKLRQELLADLRNWALLYPKLAALQPDGEGLERCRQYLLIELEEPPAHANGPRDHIVDRLYKRMSNLRRDSETSMLSAAVLRRSGSYEDAAA